MMEYIQRVSVQMGLYPVWGKICYLQFIAQYFKSAYAYIDTDTANLSKVFS